jgi:hypothetical protein
MGVDVGPGGNCMRMDEHALDPHSKHAPGTLDSQERFAALSARFNHGERITAEQVAAHFKGSKLAEDKHSAPSFYKYKAPYFFIEDRAVESLRGADEFWLVADLRLRILETLQRHGRVDPLQDFGPELHREMLCSTWLWAEFRGMAARLGLDAAPYRRFFDRQFPRLEAGQDVPTRLELREGRRPRVITDVKMRGELLISKTVDTSYSRLELLWPVGLECSVNGRVYAAGTLDRDGQKTQVLLLDYQKKGDGILDIVLTESGGSKVVEKCRFSTKDMMFRSAAFEHSAARLTAVGGGKRFYFNLETDPLFWGSGASG